jgi:hypothetical protein
MRAIEVRGKDKGVSNFFRWVVVTIRRTGGMKGHGMRPGELASAVYR